MFIDLLNLPLDSERLAREDQTLCLSGMTWEDYEQLTAARTNYHIAYFEGIITIVSPSLNHEKIAEIINGLIKTYCRKYNLLYFPMVRPLSKVLSLQEKNQTVVLVLKPKKLFQI